MPLDLTDDKSTLVQVMAWCPQAPSHYLSQCLPRPMSPNGVTRPQWVNTLRPRLNGRRFPDDIFKCIFLNENVWISIKISLKFVPKGPINNNPALVQIMTWRRPGSEPMMVRLPTHIYVTWPQWVKSCNIVQHLQWCCLVRQTHWKSVMGPRGPHGTTCWQHFFYIIFVIFIHACKVKFYM